MSVVYGIRNYSIDSPIDKTVRPFPSERIECGWPVAPRRQKAKFTATPPDPVLLEEPPPPPPRKPWYDLPDMPRDMAPPQDELRIEHVMRAAANHFGIALYELKQRRRQPVVVWRRHVAIYLCRELTTRTLLQIGNMFGGLDHTSVVHSARRVEGRHKYHPDVVAIRDRIRDDIAEADAVRAVMAAEAAAAAAEDPNQLKLALEGELA
jgi:hypothetical protein